ncbi:MAG: PEP-CTERM sorting domain-containing protein [Rubrivivax sp.]|nr:PEP-CTERM sorting domain-containing protein [Rubrivivax sp.]
MNPTLLRLGSLIAAWCCAGAASAAMLTYDIGGTITGTPLDGQTFGGHFTVDAPAGQSNVLLPLLDLDFRFDGVVYHEDDVVGAAVFRPSGELALLFGTSCRNLVDNISCELPASGNAWYFGAGNGGAAGLGFSREGAFYGADATITLREPNTVPEPSTPALALFALAVLAGTGLTRRVQPGVR